MNVLVTGSAGALGRNLVENLKNIREGKNKTRPQLSISDIYEYDVTSSVEELNEYCQKADFVIHAAGINRPRNPAEFMTGNYGFTSTVLKTLKKYDNSAPVVITSSIQATLSGRFEDSEYGKSKLAGEELAFEYGALNEIPVYIYRFPNLVGKWVKPNYNSAVGTFCNNIANDLPIHINDPSMELEIVFIDDLVNELLDCMEGHPHRCEYPKAGEVVDDVLYDGLTPCPVENGQYCYVPVTHKATLGQIVDLLYSFRDQSRTLMIPAIPYGSFAKKLCSVYLSYLPREKMAYDLKMNCDRRGSFTELVKTMNHGQFSVNITNPGITKGQHWHNSKWELFIVVSGHALIQERKIGTDEVVEFDVSGERIKAVYMLPGYTHNIINLSKTEKLVTLMWANEPFDPQYPDTFSEIV